MQQRRLRPGDVLDDYCPRERRITDHAIVAMIDDNIKQTRCVSCDTEHEYKQAKVPPQRRKKPALFTQVLDGLQAPTRPPSLAQHPDASFGEASPPHLPDVPDEEPELISDDEPQVTGQDAVRAAAAPAMPETVAASGSDEREHDVVMASGTTPLTPPPVSADADDAFPKDETFEAPVRRQLIRAALPRPEGQPPPARVMPEFTIRQPNMNGRRGRHGHAGGGGGARRGQHQQQGHPGPMRFGRGAHGQRSNGNGQGRPGGQGAPHANRSRRGGKKGR